VTGGRDDVDVEARQLQALAAVERLVGVPRLDAAPRGREEAVGLREDGQLGRGQ
jgi:hypothetical protein